MYRPEDFPPVHLKDHLRVIRKHKWAGILFFLFVVGITGLYLQFTDAKYRATVKLILKPPPLTPLTMMSEFVYFEGTDVVSKKLFTTTQFEVFKSRTLAEKVLDRLHLWEDYHLGEEKKLPFGRGTKTVTRAMAAEEFAKAVEVNNPNIMSHHIELSFSKKDPQKAALIANTIVEVYVENLYDIRSRRIHRNLEWLRKEFKVLEKEVVQSDEALQEFKKDKKLISVDERENILLEKLHAVNGSLVQARLARIAAQSSYLEAKRLARDPTHLENAPTILASNPQIAAVNGQLNVLRTEYARNRERYKERHPRMIELRSTMAELEGRIRGEVEKAVESLRLAYETARSHEEALKRELEEVQQQVLHLDQEKIEYLQLMNAAKVNRVVFDSLLSRLKETSIIQTFQNPSEIVQIIDPAVPPEKPGGYRNLYLPIASLVGLLLGVFLCYVKDYFDDSIQNERDVFEILRLPLLAVLPRAKALRGGARPDGLLRAPRLSCGESLRRLGDALEHLGSTEGLKSFLVASACPVEGRSTVTTNLGCALAERGRRVLVVDGDLRRPSIHEAFSLDGSRGLSDLLREGDDPGPYLLETGTAGLWCLPAGSPVEAPSVLLESGRLSSILQALQGEFDWILLDSPALLDVADGNALARASDAVLFLVASGATSKERASWAKRSLETVGARLLGVVLNRVRFMRGPTRYYDVER